MSNYIPIRPFSQKYNTKNKIHSNDIDKLESVFYSLKFI